MNPRVVLWYDEERKNLIYLVVFSYWIVNCFVILIIVRLIKLFTIKALIGITKLVRLS